MSEWEGEGLDNRINVDTGSNKLTLLDHSNNNKNNNSNNINTN